MEPDKKFAMIGDDPIEGQPKKVWEIPIEELNVVVPKDYYVTTGEAVKKLDVLIEDTQELLKQAKRLKKKMLQSKGESVYLETSWVDHTLICKRKDPRNKNKKKKDDKKKK